MDRAAMRLWRSVAGVTGIVSLLAALPAQAADVTARLDRQQLVEGETVTLILQTDDPQQSLDVDLGTLQRDFHVLDQRSETQMSIVNGRQSAVVRQLITLEPRRTGRLEIPPLQLEGATTEPLVLTVQAAPALAPGELPPVFIETALEPVEGPYYVHAQMSLKVRIYYQQNLTEAAINPPAPEQASVRLLDEVPFQADRNGQRYRVLERRYAIFPERSGELTIPPMQLTGRLIERPSERLWQPGIRGRRVRIESEPLIVTIRPRPREFSGDFWLPARSVDLAQQISDAESLRVGEPVTRTVILDAVGLEEHMLEEPAWPEVQDARIYPDQPQGITRDDGQWVLGHREFRYAVVPEQPGELVLPELRLRWWDTVADRERVAVVPEHRVRVRRAELAGERTASPGAESGAAAGDPDAVNGTLDRWRVMTALFAVAWLGTLVLYLRGRRGGSNTSGTRTPGETEDESETDLLKQLRRACLDSDAREVHRLLDRWLRRYGPAGAQGSLMAFAAQSGSAELASAVTHLDAVRFGGREDDSWDGTALWRAFGKWHKQYRQTSHTRGGDEFDLYAAARSGG